jgi:hypothetical protein
MGKQVRTPQDGPDDDLNVSLYREIPVEDRREDGIDYEIIKYVFSKKNMDGKLKTMRENKAEFEDLMSKAVHCVLIGDNEEFRDIPDNVRVECLPRKKLKKYQKQFKKNQARFNDQDALFAHIQQEVFQRNQEDLDELTTSLNELNADLQKQKRKPKKDELREQITEIQDQRDFLLRCMKNEVFIGHPDSIAMLRTIPVTHGFRFEGLSARVFNNRRIAIPLTKNWVYQCFDRHFVEDVIEFSDDRNYIHLQQTALNSTEDAVVQSRTFKQEIAAIRYNNKLAGESSVMLIVKMMLKVEKNWQDPTASKNTWYIKSISKNDLFSNAATPRSTPRGKNPE